MITKRIDQCEFKLKEDHDFSWISKYGTVFIVFAEQDSRNIAFGTDDGKNKYFIKYSGCHTKEYTGKCEDAIMRMKAAVKVYEDIKHPNLIHLLCMEKLEKDMLVSINGLMENAYMLIGILRSILNINTHNHLMLSSTT